MTTRISRPEPPRCLVVWLPDWPVTAWRLNEGARSRADEARAGGGARPQVGLTSGSGARTGSRAGAGLAPGSGTTPGPDATSGSGAPVGSGARPPRADTSARASATAEGGWSTDQPIAVIEANRVLACSAAARAAGVRRGLPRREAQAMCPTLQIVAADATRDQRLFDPLMTRLEELTPGIQLIRPGLAAIRARGPTRYYGGEMAAATGLIDTLRAAGVAGVRIGVADGVFTAEQAAYGDAGREGGKLVSPSEVKETPDSRREEHGDAGRGRGRPADSSAVTIVPAGGSAEFLASLPVSRLRDDDVARLLVHLGIRTLGDFARLDRGSVRDRFGDYGARLHALARGDDTRPVSARVPPVDLARDIEFETPFDQAEPVVFSVRRTAEDFISGLSADHLVCTELRVILTSERGEAYERVWLHPTAFSTASVIDRVRWQLAGSSSPLTSGVVKVRFEPVAVDAAYRHEPGLFGSGTDERVHHTLSRLQAMLGYDGVVTATIGGGRWLTERQVLVPWGERVVTPQPVNRPWPGQLPPPLPTVVFSFPRPVSVLAATGALVSVDERGNLSSAPWMMVDGHDAASVNQSQSRAAGAMNRTTGTAGAVGVAGVGRTTSGPTSAAGVGRTVGAATKIAAVSVAGGSSGAGATTRRDAVSVVRDGSVAGATDADHSFKIAAWAGPWPIDERMWDATRQRHACRFQAVDTEQRAWLLVLDEGGSWWIEGAYD